MNILLPILLSLLNLGCFYGLGTAFLIHDGIYNNRYSGRNYYVIGFCILLFAIGTVIEMMILQVPWSSW